MASIRQHRGKWQARYYDPSGRLRSRSFARKSDAKAFLAAMATDKRRGTWVDPRTSKIGFATYADLYLAEKLAIRPRTRDKYESSLHNHLVPAFAQTPIGAITRGNVQSWIADMDRRGLGAETVRGHYSLLAAIMKRAAQDGLISKSPCANVELPRIIREEQRYLSENEVEQLVEVQPPRYQVLIYTACYVGCRWQELAGLRRAALDMRPGRLATMRLVSTIERSNGRYRVVEYGKSEAARRTLKMPGFLREALAWHLQAFSNDEWVFSSPEGGFLRYDNFRSRVWLPAVAQAGLTPLTFHQLRHTAAAFMIDDGADPLQVKRRMGHKDVRTSLNVYGHLFPDREEELVAALDRRRESVQDVAQTWPASGGEVVGLKGKRAADQDV